MQQAHAVVLASGTLSHNHASLCVYTRIHKVAVLLQLMHQSLVSTHTVRQDIIPVQVMQQAHAVVLASGTLSPVALFMSSRHCLHMH